MRHFLLLFALTLALPGKAAPPWPPLTGTLQGQLTLLPGTPSLRWTLTAPPPPSPAEPAPFSRLEITGDGLRILLRARLGPAGNLTWQIDEGRVQLGPWLPALAARHAPALAGLAAAGELSVSGVGILENGVPSGSVALRARDLVLRHDAQGWTLRDLSLTAQFSLAPDGTLKSTLPAELHVGTIATPRFGARNARLRGDLLDAASLSVTTARLEIAGGEVEADPFVFSLAPPSLAAHLHIRRVGLQDFVALVPSGLRDARGRLSGDLALTWSLAQNLRLGAGTLALDEVEPTVLRLAPWPGFLTTRVPARIAFLPGKLGRLLAWPNPAHDELTAIELGRTDLLVKSLVLHLTPDGDPLGRTAHALVEARSASPDSIVEKVTFTINVRGPLATVMNLGMQQPFSLQLY